MYVCIYIYIYTHTERERERERREREREIRASLRGGAAVGHGARPLCRDAGLRHEHMNKLHKKHGSNY